MPLVDDAPLQQLAAAIAGLMQVRALASDKKLRTWCDATVYIACRKAELYVRPEVSVAAASRARELGLDLKLKHPPWKGPKEDRDGKAVRVFQWEHVTPVKRTVEDIRSLEPHFAAPDIIEVLRQVEIAWVTRDEDIRLNKKHRHIRPGKLWDTYRDLGIVIEGKESLTTRADVGSETI